MTTTTSPTEIDDQRPSAPPVPDEDRTPDGGPDAPTGEHDQQDVPPTSGETGVSEPPPDDQTPVTRNGLTAVLRTTVVCAAAALAGQLVLLVGWLARGDGPDNLLPWQPVVGASLSVVAVVAFGGFYYAALRVRVAIMGSFLLTFLLLLVDMLTVRELSSGDSPMAADLVSDFRVIVQTIVGFYFGTETVLSVTKILRAPRENAAAQRRADRDLPAG